MIPERQSVCDENAIPFHGVMKYLSEITKHSVEGYLSEVDKHPVLTEEEEQRLAERVYHGEDASAFQALVLCNLRLVARIALDSCRGSGADLDLADDALTASCRWQTGATAAPKALLYRRALPAVAGG